MSRRLSGLSSTIRMRAGATERSDPENSSVLFAISGGRQTERPTYIGISAESVIALMDAELAQGVGLARGVARAPSRSTMGTTVRINIPRIISFVIIAVVIAGIVNVYADAGPIERMARARLCERHPGPCRGRLGR